MPNPKVSVIVPNYNYSSYLDQRIESILNQTFQDFEIIILDDCSTDNSREIIEKYRDNPKITAIIYNTKNSGNPFKQWAKGISLAKGDYVWIAEADDTADPTLIETLLPPLEEDEDVRLSMAMSTFIDSDGNEFTPEKPYDFRDEDGQTHIYDADKYIRDKMWHHNTIYNASMLLFKRNSITEFVNHEYLNMRYCGDWLYWINVMLHHKIASVNKKLNHFRRHSASVSHEINDEPIAAIEQAYISFFIHKYVGHIQRDDINIARYRLNRDIRRCSYESATKWQGILNNLGSQQHIVCKNIGYFRLWLFKHIIYPIKQFTHSR